MHALVLFTACHVRHARLALIERAGVRIAAPGMLAESWVACARQQLCNYASHMDARGCGAVVYAREAGAISFGGNSWLAPWLEVGRVSSAQCDTQAGLVAAASLQAHLITWHACALHSELRQPAQVGGIELGIGGRWSELSEGAIVLVPSDAATAGDDASSGVGFVGLALPSSAEKTQADVYAEFWRGEASVVPSSTDSRTDLSSSS